MKSKEIPFSLLSLEANSEMAKQSKAIITERHPDDETLAKPLADLTKPQEMATLAIGSSQKQELTEKVNAADTRRDRGFMGFRKKIDGELYNDFNAAAREAAERLSKIIEKHGTTLYTLGLTVQSAVMISLFRDLDTEEAKADLTTIGLTEWVAQLKQAQEDFEVVFAERNKLESAKNIPTKAEAMEALVSKFTVLVDGLEFLATIKPEIYGETNKLVTEAIKRIIASERGRN